MARVVGGAAPIIAFGLFGPIFNLLATLWVIWACWGLVLVAWAWSGVVAEGERIFSRNELADRTKASVGVLWLLAKLVDERRNQRAVNRSQYEARIDQLQERLLGHLVQTATAELSCPNDAVSASFMRFNSETRNLQTKCRDRPLESRPRQRIIHVDSVEAGAAQAVRNQVVFVETDAWDALRVEAYGERLPYRSFISVPLLTGEVPIGVVNLDATIPSAFSVEWEFRIKEVGYIITVLELLRGLS